MYCIEIGLKKSELWIFGQQSTVEGNSRLSKDLESAGNLSGLNSRLVRDNSRLLNLNSRLLVCWWKK